MKYMGSKRRIAKELLPIILKNRKPGQYYVEPFVGGCNSIDKVAGLRIGNDSHFYLIEYLKKLRDGYIPPEEISEERYIDVKNNKEFYSPFFVGYVGFGLSYGGKWFGGYRRDKEGKRNYSLESFNNAMKQQPSLKGIVFQNTTYDKMIIPDKSIIYCDPPYQKSTTYNHKFNSVKFFEWCIRMKNDGHTVFVSEYSAPFKCVWSKRINSSLTQETSSKKGIEKLFEV